MRAITEFPKIFLFAGVIDFRKGLEGMAGIVQSRIQQKMGDDCLFIFIGRDRSKIRILYWDRNGFALWQKRLEQDKFILKRRDDHTIAMI